MGDDRAVVLLSGGLDSATTLAIAKSEGYEVYCLTFNYGQRHDKEIESAQALANHYGAVEHKMVGLSLATIGGSALTDRTIDVPVDQTEEKILDDTIPSTYVPARNIIFLSYALAYAEVKGAKAIFIGATAVDYSGYPDCRPEFFTAYEEMAKVGTKTGVEGKPVAIKTPVLNMTKGEIVKKGLELGVPYEKTWSCYKGGEKACGKCDTCLMRLKGFKEAGAEDPVPYE
jgi:7-cyano-7-deazaguanine synthase